MVTNREVLQNMVDNLNEIHQHLDSIKVKLDIKKEVKNE